MATDKQVNYALMLMAKAKYPTSYMNSTHKALGASMRERSGTVAGWLRAMDAGRISNLIDSPKKIV